MTDEIAPTKILRAGAVDVLKGTAPSFPTAAGLRVFDSRDLPLSGEIPDTILVYTKRTRVDREGGMGENGVRRNIMDMAVECYAIGEAGDARVDLMAWQVENALRASPTLGNRCERVDWLDTETAFADDGERVLHVAAMTFEVPYWTHVTEEEGEPPKIILLGFAPDIGPGHEGDYTQVWRAPEVTE